MPNVITLRDPGGRQYLRRTNTDARLGRLVAAIRREYTPPRPSRRETPATSSPRVPPRRCVMAALHEQYSPQTWNAVAGQDVAVSAIRQY
jgi:hypothetical protein